MENISIPVFCSECGTRLKRQVMGSNVFYYCRSCGRLSSEACFSGESEVLQVQKPLSTHRMSSTNGLKLPEVVQKATAGN